MKLSVVIPTLNEEKNIDKLLFHLNRQKPYEIIVADSDSEDGTRKVAKKHGARVVNVKKRGVSVGRNAGAARANGDVIIFIDADSIPHDNLLDTIRRDFRRKKVAGWTCSIYAMSPKWKEHVIYNMSNNIVEFLTKYMKKPHAPGIIVAVRRSAFENVGGFDEDLKVMEDHDLALRVGKLGDFMFSKDTCVYTSTRRMQKWGGLGLIKKYSSIYLKFFMNRKNFDPEEIEYEPIR